MKVGKKMKKNIGEKLQQLRKEEGLTLQEVAEQTSFSASYLHRLENSNRKNPSMNMIRNLAEFYKVEISELYDDSNEVERNQLKEIIKTELILISEKVKKVMIDLKNEESKQDLIEVQKSVLYIKSLL